MKPTISQDQGVTPHQPGHIHIDFFKAIGPLRHEPQGKVFFAHDPAVGLVPVGAGAIKPQKYQDQKTSEPYWKSCDLAGQDGLAQRVELSCCPPKVFQDHNLFGHGSLPSYVLDVFNKETEKYHIDVDPEDQAFWEAGLVQIHEAHLTANFWFEGDKLALFNFVDSRVKKGKQRNGLTTITLGGTGQRRSTHRALTIYCKYEQLQNEWKQNVGPLKKQVLELAWQTIRVEIKLYRAGLLARGLGDLRSWQSVDVDALFFDELLKYKLTGAVQQNVEYATAEKILSKPLLRIYGAWMAGQDLAQQYSRATIWRHRRTILETIGVDINLPRIPEVDMLDLSQVFTPENIMALPGGELQEKRYHKPHDE